MFLDCLMGRRIQNILNEKTKKKKTKKEKKEEEEEASIG
jgi:hypothetical protein